VQEEDKNKKLSSDLIELLQTTELFSEIHEEVAEALLKRLQQVELATGDTLFEEGTHSDSFYILIEGHLIALLKTSEGREKVIGSIAIGETVGEMGALSEQPRSLTVRATVHSKLLKLTRAEFELFSKDHPQILMNMINYIITRSQNTLKLISEKKVYEHIAIVKGNECVDINHFYLKLKEYLPEKNNIVLLNSENPNTNLSKEISHADKSGKILVFLLTPELLKSLQAKINHVGEIYIVVKNETDPVFLEFALAMAKGQHNPIKTEVRLIILHNDDVVTPTHTIKWLTQANFTMHHHLRLNNKNEYQRLIRFITGKPVGVVLGGGGGKGWACIGALKAFLDSQIPVDIIGGTSVGALIGACYAHHLDYDKLLEDYSKLSHAADKPFALKNFSWPLISLLSSKKPTEQLMKTFGDTQIEDLWIPFYSIATNLNKGKEVIHQTGLLWECLRASMALPGIIPPVVIEGQLYVDGGILNNLPVDVMRTLLGKDAYIIAISLSKLGEDKRRYSFPPIITFRMGLMRKLGLGYKDYKFPPFFNTFLNALLIGSSAREKANKLKANLLVSPDLSSFGTLKIDILQSQKILEIGYQSTKGLIMSELQNSLNEDEQ
jgi:predicted acylesterase/phospholipase RssA